MKIKKLFGSFLLMLCVIFLSGILMAILVDWNITSSFARSNQILLNQSGFLFFSLILILIFSKGKIGEYGLKLSFAFPLLKIVVPAFLLGFISGLLVSVLDFSVGNVPWGEMTGLRLIFIVWVLASVAEETLFRGLIQSYLSTEKARGFYLGKFFISVPVIISAFLFGLIHLMLLTTGADHGMVFIVIVAAVFMGIYAGYYRERTGSILPAILIHTSFNIGGSFMVFFYS